MKQQSSLPINFYGIYYHRKGKQHICRIRDKQTGHLLATGMGNSRAEALAIAQAGLPEMPTIPALFQGEMMTCIKCQKQQKSDSNIESGWYAIQADDKVYYVCPDCLGG